MTTIHSTLTKNPSADLIELEPSIFGNVFSFLSAIDAVRFSRVSPYIASIPMRDPHRELRRNNILEQFRKPIAIQTVKKHLGFNDDNTPNWLSQHALYLEHALAHPFTLDRVITLEGHIEPLSSVHFIDPTHLLTTSYDSTTRLWAESSYGHWECEMVLGQATPLNAPGMNAIDCNVYQHDMKYLITDEAKPLITASLSHDGSKCLTGGWDNV